MSINIKIPTALRAFTERKNSIPVEAVSVHVALEQLAEFYPDLKPHLYEQNGDLRSFINVFVGETNIKNLQGVDTPLSDGTTIMLVPAIAGG
ncbi:MoaD family protein [Fibrobacterales bacterium]|nr:MoaD family protein [Fibrobacterales bacterium]